MTNPKQEDFNPMPLLCQSPFDRKYQPEPDSAADFEQREYAEREAELFQIYFPSGTQKKDRRWWGLGADFCYILVKAGIYLMACWAIAIGLPLMLLLLLCMGQLDMAFLFLGSLFGAFVDATPDRQYAFAHQASWVLLALATAVAAWRLPRFLDEVSQGLKATRKVS